MSKQLKAGDKFVFHKCKANKAECANDDFTVGKIYTLYEGYSGYDSLSFKDDAGDERSFKLRVEEEGMKTTKIKE
jgi:hypothetical protein